MDSSLRGCAADDVREKEKERKREERGWIDGWIR